LTVAVNQQKGHPVATLSALEESLTSVGDRTVIDIQPHGKRLTLAADATTVARTPANDRNVMVHAAVGGDPYAIDGVLRWIRPLVLRYCRSRVGGYERIFTSADDVAQEICLAVLTALPSYRDQGRPFLAFVYGIASHKVADAHRSAARNRAEPVADVPDITDQADGPEAQLMHGEVAGRMARLMESLSEKQRDILHLRVLVGLSVEETAEAVGSTPGAVRVAQHRALNRLREVLTAKPISRPVSGPASSARSSHVTARAHTTAATGGITGALGSLSTWAATGQAV
jgi:RNA polymerase sigma-70 factor (ECF subfamily)